MVDDMAVRSKRIIVPGTDPSSRKGLTASRLAAMNTGDAS